ncbi:XdhC family protein [Magnetococcus sp. PR-3]|uniref:XdhC family protein n=1 Tax=Magnetococcus sp. PR-3 TaxID=3120355 RepID=UPI002FCE3BB5
MSTQTQDPKLLIIGCKKIGRLIARTASTLGWQVTVMDRDVPQYPWPPNVEPIAHNFLKTELGIPPYTHAIVNRGHKKDPEVIYALLERGVEHIYLIASAKRGQSIIDELSNKADDNIQKKLHKRLSAPAGLDLGGENTPSIVLSILSEIQMRHYQGSAERLNDLRPQKLANDQPDRAQKTCPGKEK